MSTFSPVHEHLTLYKLTNSLSLSRSGQSFVKAGNSSNTLAKQNDEPIDNLSTSLAIEPAKEDEEDIAMEMNSSEYENSDDSDNNEDQDELIRAQEDLVEVPGLIQPLKPETRQDSNPQNETTNSLGFAPRGLGSRGRGGRGGLGSTSRGGIGASRMSSMSMFAAATSASSASPTLNPPVVAPSTATTTSEVDSLPNSGASTPHVGIGSSKQPTSSLVDTLRAELNGPAPRPTTPSVVSVPPTLETSNVTSNATTPRQPPAQVPHTVPTTTPASSSFSTSTPSSSAPKRSFLPSAPPSSSTSKPTPKPLSRSESLHFSSLRSTNSIGLKLLEKMGWSATSGTGLGKDGTGIVVPLGEGQKLRKKGEGIKGGERSKTSWEEEARRKGVTVKELMGKVDEELVDGEDEKEERKRKKKERQREIWESEGGGKSGGAGGAGKKKEKKVKTEFKTYEEILAENGEDAGNDRPRELLVDLAGNAVSFYSFSSVGESMLTLLCDSAVT